MKSRRRMKRNCKLFTLGEYVNYWYATYKESKHALTTRQVQWSYIRVHIEPSSIGKKYLHFIKPADIQEFLNDLLNHGNKGRLKNHPTHGNPLSTWTVQKIRMLLISAFDQAVRDGVCPQNPARETEPISVSVIRVEPFSKEQQKRFLEKTKGRRFHLAYRLLFLTGLRRSEVLGLAWQYVDFSSKLIHIRQVLVVVNRQVILKRYPKTKASVRTIPIPAEIMRDLKKLYVAQTKEIQNNPNFNNIYNLVFTNKDGSPHSPDNFLKNFKNTVKSLNLPQFLHVHSTRHTFATNLLQQGVSLADVQALGGWSDSKIPLEIYAHVAKESQRKAIEKLYKSNK